LALVVFVNPHSRGSRRDPEIVDRYVRMIGSQGRVVATANLAALADEAQRCARERPVVVAIRGGDGTVHHVMTALIRAYGERPLPTVAILAGGTMNVIAASLGLSAPPDRVLEQIVGDDRAGRVHETVHRHCLRVNDSFGFVFGNGMMASFLEEYYAKAGYGPWRALWILLRTFLSALVFGRYARRILGRFNGRVAVDGQDLAWRTFTSVGAATVREVGLGFKLNHRADEDPHRFSVLAIHAGAVALARDLVAVHRGRGVAPSRAWSGIASDLSIECENPATESSYTIDGDLYRFRGRIDVRLGPQIAFVKPRRV
jgi:diacylglycerol kinase family enzyme